MSDTVSKLTKIIAVGLAFGFQTIAGIVWLYGYGLYTFMGGYWHVYPYPDNHLVALLVIWLPVQLIISFVVSYVTALFTTPARHAPLFWRVFCIASIVTGLWTLASLLLFVIDYLSQTPASSALISPLSA